ncbi:high-temperature-induced dauer-formation protein-domain-containing protein [Chytridium lagenaria]|nr:high-temperature-induced dauer-formation protein-domain-containing protein [Chytridium lagenaria]
MGATESKLAFRKNVFALYEQRNLSASDDQFWSKFYQLPETPEDVFNLFSSKDIRRVRDTASENLETIASKVSDRLFKFIASTTVPTKDDIRDALNCCRILTRILPFVFETGNADLEEKIFWTRSNSEEGENVDDRLAPRLVRGVMQLLFFRGGNFKCTPTSATLVNNRIEVLRLLLTILSYTMYISTGEVLKKTNKWAIVVATGLDKKTILTLLCSLLNTAMSYDPVGWGLIPYNHMLFGDSQEHYISLCIQLLVVSLDLGSGVHLQKRPRLSQIPTATEPTVAFPEEDNAKKLTLHTELLMLFWKLFESNEKFAKYAVECEQILTVCGALLHFCLDAKGDPNHIGIVRMACFIIHILSQERAFGVQLNTPFDSSAMGPAVKTLPLFSNGCWADFFILSIHVLITTTGKSPLSALHENFLICLANVSPYIKSLTVVSSNKLLNLFNSFSNAGFMLANESNHKLIFYLLDIFNNIVQYQITGNSHLVYAIVRSRQRFHELNDLTFATASTELQRLRAVKAERLKKLEKVGLRPSTTDPDDVKPIEEEGGQAKGAGDESAANENEEVNQASSPRGELSEKAKGKLPMSQVSGETKMKFEPTEEWFVYWKSHLRLSALITLALCVEKGFNDDKRVIEYLQSGTLVGLLPLPHPLVVRRFTYTDPVRIWFTSYMWGHVFVKNTNVTGSADVVKIAPPIWAGTKLALFNVRNSA